MAKSKRHSSSRGYDTAETVFLFLMLAGLAVALYITPGVRLFALLPTIGAVLVLLRPWLETLKAIGGLIGLGALAAWMERSNDPLPHHLGLWLGGVLVLLVAFVVGRRVVDT